MTGRVVPANWLLLLALAPGCDSLVGDYTADLSAESEPVDSGALCEVERQRFVLALDLESSTSLDSLESYYEAENPGFVERLATLAQAYANGEVGAGVTYLMGAAGVGKSFVTRNALGAFEDGEQCSAELTGLFVEGAAQLGFEVATAPDLATVDGSVVFNELPSFAEPGSLPLLQLLEAAGCVSGDELVPMVVIDGVDELEGATSTMLLRAVDDFVLDGVQTDTFVHFLVASRPEGFAGWLTAPERTEDNNAILATYPLAAPRYQTAGDLEFRLRGYLDFAGLLEAQELSGEYQQSLERFTAAVAGHPFLTYSLGNLAVGNVVIEQTILPPEKSEEELKVGLFDDILSRNAGTHGRPGAGSPHDSAYRRVLEDIAVRYVDVGEDGVFAVRAEDTVTAFDDDGDRLGEVRVRDVLDRAGVAFLTSATSVTRRYRFDPFWIHAHLVERRNQRRDPAYRYRGCE